MNQRILDLTGTFLHKMKKLGERRPIGVVIDHQRQHYFGIERQKKTQKQQHKMIKRTSQTLRHTPIQTNTSRERGGSEPLVKYMVCFIANSRGGGINNTDQVE